MPSRLRAARPLIILLASANGFRLTPIGSVEPTLASQATRPRTSYLAAQLEDITPTQKRSDVSPTEKPKGGTHVEPGDSTSALVSHWVDARLSKVLDTDGKLPLKPTEAHLDNCLEVECPTEEVGGAVAAQDSAREGVLDANVYNVNKAMVNTLKGLIDVIYEGGAVAARRCRSETRARSLARRAPAAKFGLTVCVPSRRPQATTLRASTSSRRSRACRTLPTSRCCTCSSHSACGRPT